MVIGGQAVLIYGEPRLTRDIDIILGVGPERLDDLLEFSKTSGWRVLVQKPEEFVQSTLVLPLDDPPTGIRIDLIFAFSLHEQTALERTQRVKIGKANVCFAAVEDVIVHKVTAGRPRDFEDVRYVLIENQDLDHAYSRHWLTDTLAHRA
jgi:predicted nucleotidyltransferase